MTGCPKCRAPCERDKTDVGAAIVHGPLKCPTCGWCEAGPAPKDWADDRAQEIIDHAWANLRRLIAAAAIVTFALIALNFLGVVSIGWRIK
jgi:hypothetical protein